MSHHLEDVHDPRRIPQPRNQSKIVPGNVEHHAIPDLIGLRKCRAESLKTVPVGVFGDLKPSRQR